MVTLPEYAKHWADKAETMPQGGMLNAWMSAGSKVANGISDKLGKNKSAPQQPASMVPTTTAGFYQPMAAQGRSALLQAMMQRSRAGGNPLATTPTPGA